MAWIVEGTGCVEQRAAKNVDQKRTGGRPVQIIGHDARDPRERVTGLADEEVLTKLLAVMDLEAQVQIPPSEPTPEV
jgi:hypothetical protein